LASILADKWTIFDRVIETLRYKKVIDLIPYGCILADLGCGDGKFLRLIKKRIATGYGIDTNHPDSQQEQNIFFKSGDLNSGIPLNDNTVDVATALAILEHLSRPDIFVTEIFRILKPGGVCILTTPPPHAKPLLEFLAYRLKIISEQDIKDHKNYFDKDRLYDLFKLFADIRIEYFLLGFNTFIIARKARK